MAVPNDLQILEGFCIEQQPEKDDILSMVQTSGDDQLRSVVYPIIYRFFFCIQPVVVSDFWTINSINWHTPEVKQRACSENRPKLPRNESR